MAWGSKELRSLCGRYHLTIRYTADLEKPIDCGSCKRIEGARIERHVNLSPYAAVATPCVGSG